MADKANLRNMMKLAAATNRIKKATQRLITPSSEADSDDTEDEVTSRNKTQRKSKRPRPPTRTFRIDSDEEFSGTQDSRKARKNTQGSSRNTTQSQSKQSQSQGSKSNNTEEVRYQIPHDEMISNGVHYCLVMQRSKLPIKRYDIIKVAFANQAVNYNLLLKELEDILNEVFGLCLVGVNETLNEKKCSNYILTSQFFNMTNNIIYEDPETISQNAFLFMILTAIFMSGHTIDEDTIWKIMMELKLRPNSCKKREDLHRFIKNAFIAPLYLKLDQVLEGTTEIAHYRYSWGFRAETELSKYLILKFASKHFPGKIPSDFANQYASISSSKREQKFVKIDQILESKGISIFESTQFGSKESKGSDDAESAESTGDASDSEVQLLP